MTKEELDSSFLQHGYLAPEVAGLIETLSADHAEWFALVQQCARVLRKVSLGACDHSAGGQTLDPSTVGTFILLRTAGNLEGAILLAQRGMVVEARILVRAIYENAFAMSQLLGDPDGFIAAFKADNAAAKKGQASIVIKEGLIDPDAPEYKTLAALAEAKGVKPLSMKMLAESGPLKTHYLYYRSLSDDSAHVSATSLNRHLWSAEDKSAWHGFSLFPFDDDELRTTLAHGIQAAVLTMVGYVELAKFNAHDDEIVVLRDAYNALQTKTLAAATL